MEYMNELEVITWYNDEIEFKSRVNGMCCNFGYYIISCQAIVIDATGNIMYTAFLGKRG